MTLAICLNSMAIPIEKPNQSIFPTIKFTILEINQIKLAQFPSQKENPPPLVFFSISKPPNFHLLKSSKMLLKEKLTTYKSQKERKKPLIAKEIYMNVIKFV